MEKKKLSFSPFRAYIMPWLHRRFPDRKVIGDHNSEVYCKMFQYCSRDIHYRQQLYSWHDMINSTSLIANSLIGSCITLEAGECPAGIAPPKHQTIQKELGSKEVKSFLFSRIVTLAGAPKVLQSKQCCTKAIKICHLRKYLWPWAFPGAPTIHLAEVCLK